MLVGWVVADRRCGEAASRATRQEAHAQLIEAGSGLARFDGGSGFPLPALSAACRVLELVWSDGLGMDCAAAAAMNCSITSPSSSPTRPYPSNPSLNSAGAGIAFSIPRRQHAGKNGGASCAQMSIAGGFWQGLASMRPRLQSVTLRPRSPVIR